MKSFLIYAITVGSAFAALLLLHIFNLSSFILRSRLAKQAFKHLIWPVITRRTRFTPPISRSDFLAQLLYWGGTLILNVFQVRSLQEAASRAGVIATLSLIPLLAGSRLSFAANVTGLSLRTFQYLHNTFGFMVSAQLISHIVLSLATRKLNLSEVKDRYGIIAGSALIVVIMIALPFIRQLAYELFLWTHGYLPILVIYALWYHVGEHRNVERVLLLVVIGVFGVFELSRLMRTLYKNFTGRQNLTKAIVTERSGAVVIQLDLPRPWKIQPGDFMYLQCLSMPLPSLLESHPFSIAWWEADDRTREEATTLYLLVSPQHGFTGRLLHRSNHNRPLKMIVDGPYGKEVRNLRYEVILLFASGIGIAALMPFMKAIIDDHKRSRSSVRRISLIWEIDRESDEGWVTSWMNQLLEDDQTKMLHFSLYVTECNKPEGSPKSFGKRGKGLYGKCSVPKVMEIEMGFSLGRTLVLAAAGTRIRDQLKEMMPKYIDEGAHLRLLDFDPVPERKGFKGTNVKEAEFEGVVEYD